MNYTRISGYAIGYLSQNFQSMRVMTVRFFYPQCSLSKIQKGSVREKSCFVDNFQLTQNDSQLHLLSHYFWLYWAWTTYKLRLVNAKNMIILPSWLMKSTIAVIVGVSRLLRLHPRACWMVKSLVWVWTLNISKRLSSVLSSGRKLILIRIEASRR